MSDFFQNGNVSTLHNLTRRPVEEIEAELANFASSRPIGFALPSLFRVGGAGAGKYRK